MAQAHSVIARPALGSLSGRLGDALKRAWIGHWTRKARRATVFALHALDDRTLKDIGMDRSEIESVVYARARERSDPNGRRLRMCAAGHSTRR